MHRNPDLISNSPYYLPHNSYDVSLEILILSASYCIDTVRRNYILVTQTI